MQNFILIGVVGMFGVGVVCRYGINRTMENLNHSFPVSTLAINIAGSFIAGIVYALGEHHNISSSLQMVLLVGFCGGFTTF